MVKVRDRTGGEIRAPHVPAVDYGYLFGCRHTTVRHDPHVRFQAGAAKYDLAIALMLRNQVRDR